MSSNRISPPADDERIQKVTAHLKKTIEAMIEEMRG